MTPEQNPEENREPAHMKADLRAFSKDMFLERSISNCPYCGGKDIVKRGVRKNKHQQVQLFVCRNEDCAKTFTGRAMKGTQYPWPAVLDAISYINIGISPEAIPSLIKKKYGVMPTSRTILHWYEESKPLARFERMLPYAKKMLASWRERGVKSGVRFDMVEVVTLVHRQLYRFRYHRIKLLLQMEEYKNRHFTPLMEYLDSVATDTPHQFFQNGARMSEVKSKFDKSEMLIKGKTNFANKVTAFVLQGVTRNTDRHEEVQRFFAANDSVTVATEVPVFIRKEDILHFEKVLKFSVSEDGKITLKGKKRPEPLPDVLSGHIDVVQVRNGIIHIMDYKPNAKNERPIEQLTWYALALSRRTGLRLREFKCAWFDETHYFEFFPLHVVKKLERGRTKKVRYKDGTVGVVPKDDTTTIV